MLALVLPLLWLLAGAVPGATGVEGAGETGASRAAAVLNTRLERAYYDVRGRSAADLHRAMQAAGPRWQGRRFFGLTASEVRYTYWRTPGRQGCALSNGVVELTVTITMPRWDAPREAPYALTRDWRAFTDALYRHELEHERIAVAYGEALRDLLSTLRTPSCETMDDEVRRRSAALQAEYDARQRRLDDQTDHGARTGARWPR